MSVLKCKMCGATLKPTEGEHVCRCDFCDTVQTISSSNDEKVLNTIARGNALRNQFEFDKAFNLFNQLLTDGQVDAEILWNLLLCKYGITYVDDYDNKKVPTINRTSFVSIFDDEDYKKCLELSDVICKEQYEKEAQEIDKIQQGILEVANKEEPYDIFISYKETDEIGERTEDSVLAYDIYEALSKEGYKVFLSRVTLANVIGRSYEPYIYSALLSAKAMVLVTTSEEYVNAVWVKNEWSRFLGMMKKDKDKLLIPCYKNMDPYDLPKELRNIQSVDFSKLGAIQDLKVGLEKIFNKNSHNLNKSSLDDRLENFKYRIPILLSNNDFDSAKILIKNAILEFPECIDLYAFDILADFKTNLDMIKCKPMPFILHKYYSKLIDNDSDLTKQIINSNNAYDIEIRNSIQSIANLNNSTTINDIKKISEKLDQLYKNDYHYFAENNSFVTNFNNNFVIFDMYNKIASCFEKNIGVKVPINKKFITEMKSEDAKIYIELKILGPFSASLIEYDENKNFVELGILNFDNISSFSLYRFTTLDNESFDLVFKQAINGTTHFINLDRMLIGDQIDCVKYIFDYLRKFKNETVEISIKMSQHPDIFPDYRNSKAKASSASVSTGGCYVATCVYGSYDCPEVWRLRRYRDFYLDEHWWGKAFIKMYYAVSPTLVKWFGNKEWFRKPMKKLVDKKIERAKKMGYGDDPYNDKY